MAEKIFTYEQARALIEEVRRVTLAAEERVQQLRAEVETLEKGSDRADTVNGQMSAAVQRWADEILAVGALPKGLWTVDFDSGQGFFYCWSLNENDLSHYHAYEDGFAGRKPLVGGTPGAPFTPKPPILN